jgi:lia operon protein LiaG
VSRVAGLALLTLLPATLAAQTSSYTLTGSSVAVYNLVGEATIQGGTGSSVSVQVTPVGSDAGKLKIENDEIRGRPTLMVVYPDDRIVYPPMGRHSNTRFSIRDDGTWGSSGDDDHDRGWHRGGGRQVTVRGDGDGLEAAANLKITVPAGKRVAVYVGVGRVDVSNVDGDLLVDAASADIATRGTRGSLHLDTGSGNLRIEQAEGTARLDTGSGDVQITGFRNGELNIDTGSGTVKASGIDSSDLEIDTGSGDIVLEDVRASRLNLDTGSGTVRATLRANPSNLSVETGSGDVTLHLTDPVDATVDLDTGSGDLTIEFPLQLIKKSEGNIRGRIGAGTGRISIETGSGDISLTK